jgi:uncharacterized RDD family membrane protein YckC
MSQAQGPPQPDRPGPGQPGYAPLEGPGTYMGRRLANWPQRVVAYLLDLAVFSVPVAVGFLLASGSGGSSSDSGAGIVVVGYLVGFALHVYNRMLVQGRTGRSLGKRALNLRLVRMSDGRPVGAVTAFVRELVHTLDGICLIGYLWPLWDARRQTFADKIVNTVVLAGG